MASEYEIQTWMKKATPFVYARISDKEQSPDEAKLPAMKHTPIKDQIESMKMKLKLLGLKPPVKDKVWADVASGGTMDRTGFKQMMEAVLNHKGRAYIVVSEPSRWARNTVRGNTAYEPLYERDIPILSTSDGLMSGTASEPRTNVQFLFNIKQGVAESERGNLIDRVKRKRDIRISEGILPAGIGTLYPFSRTDPLDVINENIHVIDLPRKEGGGGAAFGRLVVQLTAPHGPTSEAYYKKELERENERIAKLTPDEYATWYAFRKKWRQLQKERDYDSQKDGPIRSLNRKDVDWGLKAAQRYVNGYLRYPFSKEYRDTMPSDEQIQFYLDNYQQHLSDKDKKLYIQLVGKRSVRR
jgi:DNA invertase Pin-like site-specific DNA recombinase